MKQINLAEQLLEGTLVSLGNYGAVCKVVKHNPKAGNLELLHLGTGERVLMNRYSSVALYMCAVQLYLATPTAKPAQPSVESLRRNDPSKGEATHYATGSPYCYSKYHRLSADGTVSFWVDREDLPGYWEPYRAAVAPVTASIIANAVVLRVKYVPTKADYVKALEITRGKYYMRIHKIRDKIRALEQQQCLLNRLYERKLARVNALHRAAV